jgi:hypothetical protein
MAKSTSKCSANGSKKPICYKVERVQRGKKKKGYITVFKLNVLDGRESYSASRADRSGCILTPDQFGATIRKTAAAAEKIGRRCTKLMNFLAVQAIKGAVSRK